MKNYITKLLLVFFVGFTLLQSCSKNDSLKDNPVGGDAFRMQVITIDLPNTSLPNSEYHGSMGNSEITLTKGDEHKLLFMVPLTMALGNQDLVINDLNNMKVTYNVKDVILPDTPDTVINTLQNNLNTFQASTSGNSYTQNAIDSFNNIYQNATYEDKIKIASFYYANITILDNMVLDDYNNITGRYNDGTMALLYKHKASTIVMAAGVYIVVYSPDPLEKALGAVALWSGAYKAFEFGAAYATQNINTINIQMDNASGINNKSTLSNLELQSDIEKMVLFTTIDRKVVASDSSRDNFGTNLFFTYNTIYNGFVQQVNPILQWLNSNLPFSNFNQLPEETVPTNSTAVNNPIDSNTFSHLTLTLSSNDNLSMDTSPTLLATGQLSIKVKITGSPSTIPVLGQLNYSYSDEFTTFSGSINISVSYNNPDVDSVTIGSHIWTVKNLDVSTYSDGTPIAQVSDTSQLSNLQTGAWCYYNYDSVNGATYGKLYNIYALLGIYNAASQSNPSLRKQLAPVGWHIPSRNEFVFDLYAYLGNSTEAGKKMMEAGNEHWAPPNGLSTAVGNNISGFTALPGGLCQYSSFYAKNYRGEWWAWDADYNHFFNVWLDNSGGVNDTGAIDSTTLFNSVRLVKD